MRNSPMRHLSMILILRSRLKRQSLLLFITTTTTLPTTINYYYCFTRLVIYVFPCDRHTLGRPHKKK